MPTEVYFIEQPHIVGADYVGDITIDDINRVMDECLQLLADGPRYFLVDTTRLGAVPVSIMKINSGVKFVNHENNRWMVILGNQNPLVKFSLQVLVRNRIKFLETREQGMAFLKERIQEELEQADS